jgi:hypothetical protein
VTADPRVTRLRSLDTEAMRNAWPAMVTLLERAMDDSAPGPPMDSCCRCLGIAKAAQAVLDTLDQP